MKRRVRAGWSGYRSVSALAALAMILFALIAVNIAGFVYLLRLG